MLRERFLKMRVIEQAGETVADGLVAQQLVGLHEIPVGVGEFLDEPFGFRCWRLIAVMSVMVSTTCV